MQSFPTYELIRWHVLSAAGTRGDMRTCLRRSVTSMVLVFAFFTAIHTLAQAPTLTAAGALTIHPGDVAVPLTVTLVAGLSAAPMSIALTGMPSGITTAPLAMVPGQTATLLVTASPAAGIELFPAQSPIDANTATVTVGVVAFGGGAQAQTPLALTVSLTNPAFAPASSAINLPVVSINTGGVGIVDKTTSVPGTITIRSADGRTSYLPSSTLTDVTATFHLHGNSTLMMPKKPYTVKLNTGADLLAAMGLACGYVNSAGAATCDKSKSYVLLANYDDKTLLRDWSASALANSIPSGGAYLSYSAGAPTPSGTSARTWWAPHSLFVELYVNGAYEGNYQLMEEVKIDSHRVNVSSIANSTVTGKALTGGYLGEINAGAGADFHFMTTQHVGVDMNDPDATPEVPEQTAYFQNAVQAAENALFAPNYTDLAQGWRAYFDETTAINFYIVNDLMGNVDGGDFYGSDYFYKAQNNPLLFLGPVWDFDISSGNVSYQPIVNPTVPWMQTHAVWYQRWFSDPGFQADVVKQWNALKNGGVLSKWLADVSAEAATLQQSQANNFGRWPMQGVMVWPNPQAGGSYAAEVAYLNQWLSLRTAYLDGLFNSKAATTTVLMAPTAALRAGTAASFTASVAGQAAGTPVPTGTVSLFNNTVLLGSGAVGSTGTAIVAVQRLPAGTLQLQAVYSGDATNALSASNAVPVVVAAPLSLTAANVQSSTADTAVGSAVVLTASVVASQGAGVPTGTFTFTGNGAVLGTQPVSAAGVASLSLTTLPIGANSIQASYSGDATNQASTSNAVGVTVEAPVATAPVFSPAAGTFTRPQTVTMAAQAGTTIYYTLDGSAPTAASSAYAGPITVSVSETLRAFAGGPLFQNSPVASAVYRVTPTFLLSATPASMTGSADQGMTAAVQVMPLYGFNQAVVLGCSAVPFAATCTFSPASVTPNGAPVSSALTMTFPSLSVNRVQPRTQEVGGSVAGRLLSLSALLLLLPARRLRGDWSRGVLLLLALLVVGGVSGCGSAAKPLETVTITAVSGQTTVSTTVTVQVQ